MAGRRIELARIRRALEASLFGNATAQAIIGEIAEFEARPEPSNDAITAALNQWVPSEREDYRAVVTASVRAAFAKEFGSPGVRHD